MFQSDLNDRTYKILCFLADFHREKGYAPSIRQIGKAINVESTSLIDYYLAHLVDGGYITRDARIARSIILTPKGRQVALPVIARAE